MNIKQIITVGIAGVAMGAMALDNVEVTGVKARQRYPWNGKVDIDFTTDSTPTEPYQMKVGAFDNVGKTNLPVKTVYTEGVSFEANPCMVRTDTTRIVWDAAKDLPDGFKCTNVLVTCRDSRTIVDPQLYMIIDLSNGGISYTNAVPAGGWTEEYMTTKAVLRKIPAQSFYMGSMLSDPEHQSDEVWHKVTLTKAYYIGVFEVSKRQYALICEGAETDSEPVTATWESIRGVDVASNESVSTPQTDNPLILMITQQGKLTEYCWPASKAVSPASFFGKLRAKTGKAFDLPTEAQWECACKAGTLMPLNIGVVNSAANRALISGEQKLDATGTHYVYEGNYMPNSFGLYDMNGNVAEWCLDIYLADLGTSEKLDPNGNAVVFENSTTLSTSGVGGGYYDYITYSGKTYLECPTATSSRKRFYNIKYVATGICRVVKGTDGRTASRAAALSVNLASVAYVDGVSLYNESARLKQTYKAQFVNPTYGIRLSLTLDE